MNEHVGFVELMHRARMEAPWLWIAFQERGQTEQPGRDANNPKILEYLAVFPGLKSIPLQEKDAKTGKMVDTDYNLGELDETAWCACFVGWCLKKAGQPIEGMNQRAAQWNYYGQQLVQPQPGAICVIHKRPDKTNAAMTSSGYHVGFYVNGPANSPVLFAGNQDQKVCAKGFPKHSVVAYRWPPPNSHTRFQQLASMFRQG